MCTPLLIYLNDALKMLRLHLCHYEHNFVRFGFLKVPGFFCDDTEVERISNPAPIRIYSDLQDFLKDARMKLKKPSIYSHGQLLLPHEEFDTLDLIPS